MSKKSLEIFMNQVVDSEHRLAMNWIEGETIDCEELIALGADHGCEFTAEDFEESLELGDIELDDIDLESTYVSYSALVSQVASAQAKKGK